RAPRTGSSEPRSSFRSRRASRVFGPMRRGGTPDQGLMAPGSADCQDPGMRDDQDSLTRRRIMTRWPASKNERSAMTMRTRARMIRPLAACGVILAFVAVVLALHGRVQAQAPRANQPPPKVERPFVQNATSGSFDGKTLTLKSVGPTLYFSDRPERITGQLRTSEFVSHWTKGADS